MIDWLTFELRGVLHRPIADGAVIAHDDDGAIEWRTVRRRTMEGSASATVRVRSGDIGPDGFASSLQFDGNPSKFSQGHNLYGSDDLPALVYHCAATALVQELARRAAASLEQPDPCELHATLHALARAITARPRAYDPPRAPSVSLKGATSAPVAMLPGQATHDADSPHVSLSRVDITYMADLGTDAACRDWIAHAKRHATMAARPGTLTGSTTVYFGAKASRLGRVKFYAKGPEFTEHPPRAARNTADEQQPLAFRERDLLQSHATGKLRAEVMMRSRGLAERGLRYAADWNANTARALWLALMEGFDMPTPADTLNTAALPKHLALALHAWKGADDLRARYSRAQWYRIRRELRELAGVDIAEPCTDPLPPLRLGGPVAVRDWPRNIVEMFPADDEPAPPALRERGLYFEPNPHWRIPDRPAPQFPPPYRPAHCPWPRDPADHRPAA